AGETAATACQGSPSRIAWQAAGEVVEPLRERSDHSYARSLLRGEGRCCVLPSCTHVTRYAQPGNGGQVEECRDRARSPVDRRCAAWGDDHLLGTGRGGG